MADLSRLFLSLGAGVFAVSLADAAPRDDAPSPKSWRPQPKRARPTEPIQTQPAPLPRQFFPDKAVQPLTPELEQTLKPKDSFKECENCPEMVVVPAGSFTMGTPADEYDRRKGEDPQHRVTIAIPFAVGRFAITFDEWDACVAEGGCKGDKGVDRGDGRGRRPADDINFAEAKSYLGWLSKKVGRTYRLPSESEREYFARAGTTTPFWFGRTISSQNANYDASFSYLNSPRGEPSKGSRPVDAYPPNPFGLYQVNGNAEEWTEDCFNKRYNEDTPTDGSPWLEGDCSKRMVRGGGWAGTPTTQRTGYRTDAILALGNGFRVVRSLNVHP